MRWGTVILLGVFFVIGAGARVVVIDGPGDGNGDGTDDHDTIQEAIKYLGLMEGLYPDGGVPDDVHIVVDRLTEQAGLLINGGRSMTNDHLPLRDDLVIDGDADGNGVECVVDFSSPAGLIEERYAFIHIVVNGGQSITLRNLTVMPTYIGNVIAQDFIDVWDGEEPLALNGSELTFENFFLTASLPSMENGSLVSVPQDPDDTTLGGTRITDGFNEHVVLRMFADVFSSDVTVNIRDSVFAHQQAGTLKFTMHKATLNVTNTRVVRCGFRASGVTFGSALHWESREDSQVALDHFIAENNWGNGLIVYNALKAGEQVEVNIEPGCRFNSNSETGVIFGEFPGHNGALQAQVIGTEEEPVEMSGNKRGCAMGLHSGSSFIIDYAVITDNLWSGLLVNPEPLSPGELNLVANTLIANNAVFPVEDDVVYPAINCTISAGSTASGPVSVEFRNCTFHDVVSQQISEVWGMDITDPTEIVLRSYSPFDCEVILTNCITSGSSDEDAFFLSGGAGSIVTLNDSCVALEGEHTIGELRQNAAGTLNLNDTLFIGPQYVNTATPPDDDSFDVRQPLFFTAGPASGPLTGWGDFVADMYDHAGLVFH